MKSSPLQPQRNLQILYRPSSYPAESIGSKVPFAQYDNNIVFGILNSPFPCVNLPRTTRVLRSVLSSDIKNISYNIYQYFPHHSLMVELKWKGLTLTSPHLQSYQHLQSGWFFPLLPHTTSPLSLRMSKMPSIVTSRLPLSSKLFTVRPITYPGSSSPSLPSTYNLYQMANMPCRSAEVCKS